VVSAAAVCDAVERWSLAVGLGDSDVGKGMWWCFFVRLSRGEDGGREGLL